MVILWKPLTRQFCYFKKKIEQQSKIKQAVISGYSFCCLVTQKLDTQMSNEKIYLN